ISANIEEKEKKVNCPLPSLKPDGPAESKRRNKHVARISKASLVATPPPPPPEGPPEGYHGDAFISIVSPLHSLTNSLELTHVHSESHSLPVSLSLSLSLAYGGVPYPPPSSTTPTGPKNTDPAMTHMVRSASNRL
ncbi:hypothetical protein L249_0435, partial [Ophiocordyceps polyrhachis-furcata BCC 54312]